MSTDTTPAGRDLDEHSSYVARIVDSAPALSRDQRARIAAQLLAAPVGGTR